MPDRETAPTCAAAIDVGTQSRIVCPDDVYYRATYSHTCADWPESKTFCAEHGVRVVGEWRPPFEYSVCSADGELFTLTKLEVVDWQAALGERKELSGHA